MYTSLRIVMPPNLDNLPRSYVGRFAPSPSGDLHMGSLVCALASYLDARSNAGKWLVRIEDIDPPREQIGASKNIISTLASHNLFHDLKITYQSQRSNHYYAWLEKLKELQLIYPCSCTRARLKDLHGRYDHHCLTHPPLPNTPTAWRINRARAQALLGITAVKFIDKLQGSMHQQADQIDDFVVHRKDGLFAYQLAVVLDDIDQNISHIVRGFDLIDTTFNYLLLYKMVQFIHPINTSTTQRTLPQPQFMHVPVLLDENNNKMSKQNHAPRLEPSQAHANIVHALTFLGFDLPLQQIDTQTCEQIIDWAIAHWPQAQDKIRNVREKQQHLHLI